MTLPEHNAGPHKRSQLTIFSEYLFQHVQKEHGICIQLINENIFQTFTADELYLTCALLTKQWTGVLTYEPTKLMPQVMMLIL
jgi:hypothetical protein